MNPKAAKALGLQTFDAADYLKTEEDCAQYLSVIMEDGDPALMAAALGDVARARGMTQVAREAGLTREGLYKALSAQGNPSFATVVKVMHAMGLQLSVQPMGQG